MISAENTEQQTLEKLHRVDPNLSPEGLSQFFSKYKDFKQSEESGLWIPEKKLLYLEKNKHQHKKIMLLFSGISSAGKDTIRKEIERLIPGLLSTIVTATTRDIRVEDGEEEGINYYYYQEKAFRKAVKSGEFIEHTPLDGSRIYGTPKKGLLASLEKDAPVSCALIEMRSGWPGVDKYFQEELKKEFEGEKPFIIKIFVMPKMNFTQYKEWLEKNRPQDWESRLKTAIWELSVAADRADIILLNTINEESNEPLELVARAVIKQLLQLLEPGHGFQLHEPPTSSMNQVRNLHRSQLP